ncbi:DUF6053 domain-containing protein [Lysobacter enzymogenes]|uniref:DUF6053 domain-containing protein n=1 Tax=Lysobacter enzymogenes TaxID=69 RepID=UPI003D18B985
MAGFFVGGTSVPMLSFQFAATRKEGIGTEVPPHKRTRLARAKFSPEALNPNRLTGSTSPDTSAPCAPG